AAAGAVHRGHVGAQADEPLGHQAADLSGAEDDVTATHDCSPSLALSRTGATTVRAVTTTAPLLPKTVNWSSTAMPAAEVTAQPRAQMPARAAGQANAIRPRLRRRASARAAPTARPHTAPWTTRAARGARQPT